MSPAVAKLLTCLWPTCKTKVQTGFCASHDAKRSAAADEPPRNINTWDQLRAAVAAKLLPKKHALAISYMAASRQSISSGVHVWSPHFDTDPNAAWYHHKKKHFGGRRVDGIAEAKAWVAKTYGYTGPWVGNARHDQIPAIIQKNFPIKRKPK